MEFGAPGRRSDRPLAKRLEELEEKNEGYHFVQQNGQRIFETMPHGNMEIPPAGCEVFIGNIPKLMFEDQLIPMFQTVGKLWKFRLMLDFKYRTRGYGFATYFSPQDAYDAIAKFDKYEVQPNIRLGVHKSLDNRRLFIGNIPKNTTREEIETCLTSYISGLVNIILYPHWECREKNRGFAFVEFQSHMLASLARRQLHPRNLVIWNQSLYVDWADPIPEVDPVIMEQVTVVYVKNLPPDWSKERIITIFQSICQGRIIRTHKNHTYAFVHCENREDAETVMALLYGLVLDGRKVEVEWARPRQYSSEYRARHPPRNFCLNVPLRSRRVVQRMTQTRRALHASSDSDSDQAASSVSSATSVFEGSI